MLTKIWNDLEPEIELERPPLRRKKICTYSFPIVTSIWTGIRTRTTPPLPLYKTFRSRSRTWTRTRTGTRTAPPPGQQCMNRSSNSNRTVPTPPGHTLHVGASKRALFRARLPPFLTLSTRYQPGWNVTKCHAGHAKQHYNLLGNLWKGEVLQLPP